MAEQVEFRAKVRGFDAGDVAGGGSSFQTFLDEIEPPVPGDQLIALTNNPLFSGLLMTAFTHDAPITITLEMESGSEMRGRVVKVRFNRSGE